MSITANYPNVRPSLLLDFANSQQLDPRVTFSRSTTAPYYDGKTSVLAEQNLLTYSQVFTNAIWQTNSTITGNTTTAPDGTTTASTFLTPAGLVNPYLSEVTPITNAIAYTYSVSLKYLTNQFAYLKLYGNTGTGSWGAVVVDLINGTITSTQNGSSATVNATSIVAQPNGFYRVSITVTQSGGSATTGCGGFIQLVNTGTPSIGVYGNYTWTALGTESIYAWGAQLEQRSSVTAYNATTTTAITNYIPQLLTAPINAPRFDFNPTTGESLGLLIEQSSTNLLTYSQDFSNASWNKLNATITSSANIAPDGTQTAQMFVLNNGATIGSGTALAKGLVVSNGSYSISIYAKANQLTTFSLQDGSGNGGTFNLSAGTVSSFGSNILSTSITSVGNGWYRCVANVTIIGAFITWYLYPTSGTANGYNGIYIWGAQLEALAFPTSYIPTTSAQVTRASDNASMTGTNFSSWYNNAQGTAYIDASYGNTSGAATSFVFYNTSVVNDYWQVLARGSNQANGQVSGAYVNLNIGQPQFNTSAKVAFAVSNGTWNASVNGGSAVSASANIPQNINSLYLGTSNQGNSFILNGRIKKFAYYPIAFTGSQNQALTGS